jgi:hypothetical protein
VHEKGNNSCSISKRNNRRSRKGTTVVSFKKGKNRHARKGTKVVLFQKGNNRHVRKEQHHHEHVKDRVYMIKQNRSMK